MAAPLLEALGLSADLAPTLTYVMTGLALLTLMTLVFSNVHILSSMMPEVFSDAKTHDKPAMAQSTKKLSSFKGMALVGPSGSGKTALYQRLLTGQVLDTVSSIDVNHTANGMQLRIPSKGDPIV